MKILVVIAALAAVAAPSTSKTIRLSIVHTVRGCHIWQATRSLGPTGVLTVKRGDKIVLRISCPMNFSLKQLRGPKLALGAPTIYTGTSRTIAFPKRGTYVVRAVNLQTSTEMGLQTLGADNTLTLTVKVL